MRFFYNFILFCVCATFPFAASAEMPSSELITNRNSSNDENSDDSRSDRPARVTDVRGPRATPTPAKPARVVSYNSYNKTTTSTHSTHNNSTYKHHSSSNATYHKHYVNRNYTVSRPTYKPAVHHTYRPTCRSCYLPTIVYSKPAYTSYSESNIDSTSSSYVEYDNTYKLGFGIRGVVATNSSFGNINNDAFGGIGFYIKYRPIRYFSVELINDYLFGTLKYESDYTQEFTKVPLSLGARFHFLDYGSFDAYAALAASMSIWSYVNLYDSKRYHEKKGIQFGGQLGIGVGYIFDPFEISFDARYTLESVPSYVPYYENLSDDYQTVHGALFSLNLGFSL